MDQPINAVAWSVGSLALYIFAFRSWRSHRITGNPLARMYYVLGLTFGTALFFFGVPALVTLDTRILRYSYFFADLFVQISMQVQVWLLWFLGLQRRVRLDYLYLATIPFSAILMTLQATTSQVAISLSPYLVVYTDEPVVLALKSIIYVAIALPIGYFLLRQAPQQTSFRAKLKSFVGGMTFIVICLAATSNNIFDKGSDTPASAAVVLSFFIIFIIVQLLRPAYRPPARRP
ncbi:MAG TPA: hypothetical protein VFX84_00310 [Candidatus Saccharimonadales bacterium]|nr:hypothetical protein [Candidatus Saccharimonadales bacterium]